VSTKGRIGVGGSSDGQDEQSRIVLPLETGEQPSLSSGLSDAPWLNRRRPGSLYSIIEYEPGPLLLRVLLLRLLLPGLCHPNCVWLFVCFICVDGPVRRRGTRKKTRTSPSDDPSVCRLFIFLKVTGPNPPKGRPTRTPPPVVPHPESLAAQAAFPFGHSAIAQISLGPNCFRALGSSPGLLQGPIL
jgi:hypothetical protein